jgi:uncharacterized protein
MSILTINAPVTDAEDLHRALPRMAASQPRSAHTHVFQADAGWQLMLSNGSQLFDISAEIAAELQNANHEQEQDLLHRLGIDGRRQIDDAVISEPKLYALSLAIAQKCNLGCTYCYAQQGDFGASPRNMSLETAKQSVDLLLREAQAAGKANIAFLGGEPLVNRPALRDCVIYANEQAQALGVKLSYAITTNGTLLRPDDAEFFEQHGFAVTISLDGGREQHDALRPFRNGTGSFDRIVQRIAPLLSLQKQMQVSARVTVTPQNLQLPEVLEQFIGMGFHSVGFSPMLRSPTGQGELGSDQLAQMLEQMIACGELTEQRLARGQRYPFANLMNALREIGRGTHRPYPCGAGAGYMGVSADGELSACHRFVGDAAGSLGNLVTGIDRQAQQQWLSQRHVHQQSPCNQCWARYLCGGGCHHEVIARGRGACDYIRGWLQYCLEAWLRLDAKQTNSNSPVMAP